MAVTEAAWRGSTPHASPSNLCPLRPPHRHKYTRIIHVHTCIYIYVRIAYIHIHTHMHTHTHTHTTSCGCVGRPNHVSLPLASCPRAAPRTEELIFKDVESEQMVWGWFTKSELEAKYPGMQKLTDELVAERSKDRPSPFPDSSPVKDLSHYPLPRLAPLAVPTASPPLLAESGLASRPPRLPGQQGAAAAQVLQRVNGIFHEHGGQDKRLPIALVVAVLALALAPAAGPGVRAPALVSGAERALARGPGLRQTCTHANVCSRQRGCWRRGRRRVASLRSSCPPS